MSPDEVARQLIIGLKKDRFIIIPGFDGKITWLIKRLFPSLVEAVLDGQIRKVQKRLKNTQAGAKT